MATVRLPPRQRGTRPSRSGQSGLRGRGMGRSQRDGPVRASRRGNLGESVRVHAPAQTVQNGRIVHEVVVDEDEHQQGGPESPCEFIVVRQLVDLAGAPDPERRGRDVQMAKFLGGEFLQPNRGRDAIVIEGRERVKTLSGNRRPRCVTSVIANRSATPLPGYPLNTIAIETAWSGSPCPVNRTGGPPVVGKEQLWNLVAKLR